MCKLDNNVSEKILMGERTYNIQGISFRYRIIITAIILTVGLFIFCSHFQLDVLYILAYTIVTSLAFISIGFIYKKTIPVETVILNSKGFSYSKQKKFPLKKEENYFFEWKEIIGYETFEFRWTQEFQLNFKDLTCFKFNRSDIWSNDDFDEMYKDLQNYNHLFEPSDNPNPIGITIYETKGLQFAMILISLFTIFIGYHSIFQPSKGGMIIIAIFGFASLYYWYSVLDNWSKKRK